MGSKATSTRAKKEKSKRLEPDPVLWERLKELRASIDLINQRPDITYRGKVYRGTDKEDWGWIEHDGWKFGYRVRECFDQETLSMQLFRQIAVRCEDDKLGLVPELERTKTLVTVFATLTDPVSNVEGPFDIDDHEINFVQKFMPFVLTEKNPGLRVPNDPKSKLIQ